MSVYDAIRAEGRQLIEQAAIRAATTTSGGVRDALSLWGWRLLADFIRLAEDQLAPGPDKKAAVLKLAADFYDRVIAPLDLPGPDRILDPLARAAWLQLCDHAIDGLIALVKSGAIDGLQATLRKAG
jgi:hypothetical protein